MPENSKTFPDVGQRLKSLREAISDLTQKQWAERHNFGVSQYSNWENGIRRIPVDDAEKLCVLYGVTLDFIYRGRRDGLPDTLKNMW